MSHGSSVGWFVAHGAANQPPLQVKTSALPTTVGDALVATLLRLGVEDAFGVSGGAMAALWHALSASELRVRHFRHESGAAFAAVEAHFASDRPVAVFTTTGPGLTNALTGLLAARDEGAKIVVLSACTAAAQRGRWAIQETTPSTMPGDLYVPRSLFHFATVLESPAQLPQIARRLGHGFARPGGFVAHLAIPTAVQRLAASAPAVAVMERVSAAPSRQAIDESVRALSDGPFAIWVGFGARGAATEVRALAHRTGAAVICSPRAKGIFPEDDPLFAGVTGMGGHPSLIESLARLAPRRVLVLGSRLGEATSLWDPRMVPPMGFVHVDVDPDVPGVAYPEAPTLAITAEIRPYLRALLDALPDRPALSPSFRLGPQIPPVPPIEAGRRVRPEVLMDAIQRQVVDESDAILLAESGNSFAWTTHHLRFASPRRYRVSTGIGAMGHATTGVVGAALATGGKAVAVVGDGAMQMNCEVNTAVKFAAQAVWVVLNDARYGMCAQGMATLGLAADADFPEVDFAAVARAHGALGVRVEREGDLESALALAMAAPGPVVLDVLIDPSRRAPAGARNRGLHAQIQDGADAGRRMLEVAFPVHGNGAGPGTARS